MLDSTFAYGLNFLFPAKDRVVGATLRRHGEFARPELDFLLAQAEGAGTLIDVGANIGAIGLPFAQQRPDWRVLAVEAHRGLAGLLVANALNNRLYNVEVFQAAAGAAPGLADFPAPKLSDDLNFGLLHFIETDQVPMEPVRILTLDQIAPPDTRLVKIDVEGFEPEVLSGARNLLASRKATWVLEATAARGDAGPRAIRILQEAGYGVYWFYAPFATPRSPKGPPRESPLAGDANVVALPPGAPNAWNLTPVVRPDDRRPQSTDSYPYLARYGYG